MWTVLLRARKLDARLNSETRYARVPNDHGITAKKDSGTGNVSSYDSMILSMIVNNSSMLIIFVPIGN
jgi:hypothetical protein